MKRHAAPFIGAASVHQIQNLFFIEAPTARAGTTAMADPRRVDSSR